MLSRRRYKSKVQKVSQCWEAVSVQAVPSFCITVQLPPIQPHWLGSKYKHYHFPSQIPCNHIHPSLWTHWPCYWFFLKLWSDLPHFLSLFASFPWFFTFNTLQEYIPKPDSDKTFQKFGRNAFIGFTSSVVSDCCSNSLRVIKTTKQTHQTPITYYQAVRMVLDADGVVGLFGRGLSTRIIANGFQGLTFSVIWKALEEKWNKAAQ